MIISFVYTDMSFDPFPNHLAKLLKLYPDKPWNWGALSRNPNITWKIIQANLDKLWNWKYLSCNSNITWKIVRANLGKPWEWYCLSCNPNITWEIIQANTDKPWDWARLSENNFNKDKIVKQKIEQRLRKYYETILLIYFNNILPPEMILYIIDSLGKC
mgnify:CR=1 FL=1